MLIQTDFVLTGQSMKISAQVKYINMYIVKTIVLVIEKTSIILFGNSFIVIYAYIILIDKFIIKKQANDSRQTSGDKIKKREKHS